MNMITIGNQQKKTVQILFAFLLLFMAGNTIYANTDPKKKTKSVTTIDPSKIDVSKIYIPNDLKENDFYKSNSKWFYGRSKQSAHFIMFWDAKYAEFADSPGSKKVPEKYRVDPDDMLAKAEQFYELNITQLKFAETGASKSKLDTYKMMIFLFYQDEWLATGSGYDDTIGALWVNPATCKPVGSVIAHEIGHTFQYQVFCDQGTSGFRYGFGGNGGNGFWEQTAQWQSFQTYPKEEFEGYTFKEYVNNYHKHICHEDYRYGSYFIHEYWADKHGRDFISKIWRNAKQPEDPLQAYMRITNITVDQLNDEIYDAATKFVTWDINSLRTNGANSIGILTTKFKTLKDSSYQITYDCCPGTTGYNVIRLTPQQAGTVVSATLKGLVNADGYNQVNDIARAGWRYGYVALLRNGTRVYSNINKDINESATFTIPDNCDKFWLVVTGAPNTYAPHPWDDNNKNDDQWPYSVKFINTDLYEKIDDKLSFNTNDTPKDVTIELNVNLPVSAASYTGVVTALGDKRFEVAKAFVLQPSELANELGDKIKFYGVESSGAINTTAAAKMRHWFTGSGDVTVWGATAKVYSEYDESNFTFTVGQYPKQSKVGDKYTVKQALVYEYTPGKTVQATFVLHINMN